MADVERDVIVLVDLLGLPAERTAQRLGIGVRATKNRFAPSTTHPRGVDQRTESMESA